MGINREQEKQITAVATTWLLEKKVVAVEPLRLYLARYAELHLSDEDIAECLLHLLQGRHGDVQGLSLAHRFTFSMALIGHWTSSYDVLAIEVVVEGRKVYAFYGISAVSKSPAGFRSLTIAPYWDQKQISRNGGTLSPNSRLASILPRIRPT